MNDESTAVQSGWVRFGRFFFALGDTTRQQIVLIFERHEEICVNDIAARFKLSRPAISHHLKILRNAHILECEKRGKEVYYRINYTHCSEVLRAVLRSLDVDKPPAVTRRAREETASV